MYEINDAYREQISKEENTPITLLRVNTGYYWDNIDSIETDDWVSSGDYAVSSQTTRYKSYNNSYKIILDTVVADRYGQVSKDFVFSDKQGLRVWYYVEWGLGSWVMDPNNYGCLYVQLIVDGIVKVEKDIANCQNRWDHLELIEDLDGTKTVVLKFVSKNTRLVSGVDVPVVYFDNLDQYIQDAPLYITTFDQDVSWYIPGTSTPQIYTTFPIRVDDMKSQLTGEVEGVTITLGNASLEIISLLLSNDALYGEEVTIVKTFWECRVGGPEESYTAYQLDLFEIDSPAADEGKGVVSFVLKSKFAVNKVSIPLEPFDRDFCRHTYKDPVTCQYAGALADCDQTKGGPNGCQVHDNVINFGACPGIPSGRVMVG